MNGVKNSILIGVVGVVTKLDGPWIKSRQVHGLFLSSEPSKRLLNPNNWYRGSNLEDSCRAVKFTTQYNLL
jgi:hypothetical protein